MAKPLTRKQEKRRLEKFYESIIDQQPRIGKPKPETVEDVMLEIAEGDEGDEGAEAECGWCDSHGATIAGKWESGERANFHEECWVEAMVWEALKDE